MHLACTLHITWEYHFWYTWTILFSKIYHMLGLSGTLSYAVFVYLCIFVFVFLYLRFWHMGISFLIYLNNPLFKNILHVGSFWHFVICCICVFVCLCICVFVFGLGRSLLDQFGQKNASPLSSTFWFERPKLRYVLKTLLHCKGSQISCSAITHVKDCVRQSVQSQHNPILFSMMRKCWLEPC